MLNAFRSGRSRGVGRSLRVGAALVALVLGGQAAVGGAVAPRRERVRPGDTLSGIARRLGIDVAALATANDIVDVHRIRAGDRLVVPVVGDGPPVRPVVTKVAATAGSPRRSDPDDLPAKLRASPERLALLSSFDAAAARYGVPADLLKALTWLESGWQNHKVSSTKAVGIGQLMPATVDFLNEVLLSTPLDPGRPRENIAMSARFLAYLLDETDGDVAAALASYYQGLASVRRHGPGGPTRQYVADVIALRRKF